MSDNILTAIDAALRKLGNPDGIPKTPIPELQKQRADIGKLHTSSGYAVPGPQPPIPPAPTLPAFEVPPELRDRLHQAWVNHAKVRAIHDTILSPDSALKEFNRRQKNAIADPAGAAMPDTDSRDLLLEYTRRRKLLLRKLWLDHGIEHLASLIEAARLAAANVETHVRRVRDFEEAVALSYNLPMPRPSDTLRSLLKLHDVWGAKLAELERLQAERAADNDGPNGPYRYLPIDSEILNACNVPPPTPEELADAPAELETTKGRSKR